jgi:hypothetical protein
VILRKFLFISIVLLVSCNKVETGDTLSNNDIKHIQELQLLDKGEKIYKFYSEYKNKVAGNFFTDKRMASYWIDDRDKSKDKRVFAYYPDIKAIDTIFYAGSTYCPYMLVTKQDNSQFKVCVDGKRNQIKAFFEEALSIWTQKKGAR